MRGKSFTASRSAKRKAAELLFLCAGALAVGLAATHALLLRGTRHLRPRPRTADAAEVEYELWDTECRDAPCPPAPRKAR